MKPTRYDVTVTQSLTADAHRTDDALREAMARVFPDVPWSPDLDDIGWGGELPDGRLVTRYHLKVKGRGTVVVTVTPATREGGTP